MACDARDQAAVDAAVAEAVGRLGGLDVLIDDAGLGTPQSAGEPPDPPAAPASRCWSPGTCRAGRSTARVARTCAAWRARGTSTGPG